MDTENPSAPTRVESRTPGKNHRQRPHRSPYSGVVHDNTRHTSRFTVIGNHLAQHQELSGLAIGIAVHIQSLPTGAPVDIKTLSTRFPEGATRIASVLRELETHGYLRRTRERLSCGRMVTRTVSCNQPAARTPTHPDAAPPAEPPAIPATPTDEPADPAPDEPRPQSPHPDTEPHPEPGPAPRSGPRPRKLPAVPVPGRPSPALLERAVRLLTTLRCEDRRLLLSAADIEHLTPGVVAWLERDLTPTAVRDALTANLPMEPLYRPAALLAHRLAAQLPPPLPYRPPAPPPPVRHPLRNCEDCDHAYRGPDPGRCPGCASRHTPPPTSADPPPPDPNTATWGGLISGPVAS
jgi:hypothetical protein